MSEQSKDTHEVKLGDQIVKVSRNNKEVVTIDLGKVLIDISSGGEAPGRIDGSAGAAASAFDIRIRVAGPPPECT